MISEPMKRKIPTTAGLIRELKWIGGGVVGVPPPWP